MFSLTFKLEAEAVPEVSEKYEISSVPTFLFFKVRENGLHIAHMNVCQVQQFSTSKCSFYSFFSVLKKEQNSLFLVLT